MARLGDRLSTGFVAWPFWLGVHLVFLIGFRHRLAVLLDWAWNHLFFERAVRLILPRGVANNRPIRVTRRPGMNSRART